MPQSCMIKMNILVIRHFLFKHLQTLLHASLALPFALVNLHILTKAMDERLNEVARTGTIDLLYDLIKQDQYILERADEIPFVDTPLHKAAKAGNIHFAVEMMRLKPSFTRKLNQEGFCPIHLAIVNDKFDLVFRMIRIDRELVRVQGKEGFTAVHRAAEKGNVELMVECLLACPESILDINVKGESALHVAVQNNNNDTVKVMLEWLSLVDAEFVLGWTDEKGDNVLHIAATKNNVQAVNMLIPKMDIYAVGSESKSALDIMQAQTPSMFPKEMKPKLMQWLFITRSYIQENTTVYCDINNNSSLTKSLQMGFPWYKKWILSNHRQMSLVNKDGILVVAVLIATTAYQAVVSLPTVFNEKFIAPASHYYFFIFQLFNTGAFVAAMSLIYILLPDGISYMITLIMPIIVCYFVGIYLSNFETGLFLFTLILFVWQLGRYGRLDRHRDRRHNHSLLKHCASFSMELQKKGYKYQG